MWNWNLAPNHHGHSPPIGIRAFINYVVHKDSCVNLLYHFILPIFKWNENIFLVVFEIHFNENEIAHSNGKRSKSEEKMNYAHFSHFFFSLINEKYAIVGICGLLPLFNTFKCDHRSIKHTTLIFLCIKLSFIHSWFIESVWNEMKKKNACNLCVRKMEKQMCV